MEDIYELVEMHPRRAHRCQFGWSQLIFIAYQIVLNMGIYCQIEEFEHKILRYYTPLLVLSIIAYFNLAYSNPGTVRIKPIYKDNFNQNMEAIETQFRAGNISFLEPKIEEAAHEPIQTEMTNVSNPERPRHMKKKSVLVKDLDKLNRHRSKSPAGANRTPMNKRPRKHSDIGGHKPISSRLMDQGSDYHMNKKRYKDRRRVIGDSHFYSTNIMKSTTATNHQETLGPDGTVRKVQKFINNEAAKHENQETLNIKVVHEREETKSELKSNKTYDTLNPRSTTYEGDDPVCDKTIGDATNIDLEARDNSSKKKQQGNTPYCSVCQSPQPPRTVHCFHCKSCIANYDHHSPLINSCIGEQNKKFLFLFQLLFLLQVYYAMGITYTRLEKNVPYPPHIVLSLIVSAISEMFVVPIFGTMVLYQIYIALYSFNTCELFNCDGDVTCKHICSSPYNKGICSNFISHFCKWSYSLIRYEKWHIKEAKYLA
ncbi:unnamed protein product [Moneuplotes crassus]|uniref:Palmitoyltransferase n=1 Tax=Euplotes crassus TaxID=5936 RepID=A0AAD1X8T4_EUPCR|nr:unnamed protein product [Moneuplotes crassus]